MPTSRAGDAWGVGDACVRSFFGGRHLVGDVAYLIGPNLVVLYRDNGYLSTKQTRFNGHLSSADIERTFGLLKGRFQKMFCLETRRPDIIVTIIRACVLHSGYLMWGDRIKIASCASWAGHQQQGSCPLSSIESSKSRNAISLQIACEVILGTMYTVQPFHSRCKCVKSSSFILNQILVQMHAFMQTTWGRSMTFIFPSPTLQICSQLNFLSPP